MAPSAYFYETHFSRKTSLTRKENWSVQCGQGVSLSSVTIPQYHCVNLFYFFLQEGEGCEDPGKDNAANDSNYGSMSSSYSMYNDSMDNGNSMDRR